MGWRFWRVPEQFPTIEQMVETNTPTGRRSTRATNRDSSRRIRAVHRSNDNPSLAEMEAEGFIVPLCAVFRNHLRTEKQKFTPERAQVLDAIIQMDRVFEAEELLLELRARGMRVSKATIYRTLKLLIDADIIEQILYDQKQAHYQLSFGRPPRDQMICVESGEIIEFVESEIRAIRDRISKKHGWTPVGHRFQIFAIAPKSAKPT
jgi:Fur family ferric uptake transcriptional regulator